MTTSRALASCRPTRRQSRNAIGRKRCVPGALLLCVTLASCVGSSATPDDIPTTNAGSDAVAPEGEEPDAADVGLSCKFEEEKTWWLANSTSGPNAGRCEETSFDGTAIVSSSTASQLLVTFGQGCTLSLVASVPAGFESEAQPAVLPALQEDSPVWLTWRFKAGLPYSGDWDEAYAIRESPQGALIVAGQHSYDPASTLASASSDLGLSLRIANTGECTESVGSVGCYGDVQRTWHSVEVGADRATIVPARASSEVALGGATYVFALWEMYTGTGTRVTNCADGSSLSQADWGMWRKP